MDILLITDGLADIDVEKVNKLLDNKIDLHTVIISTMKKEDNPEGFSELKQVSKNFMLTSAKKDSDVVAITNLFSK